MRKALELLEKVINALTKASEEFTPESGVSQKSSIIRREKRRNRRELERKERRGRGKQYMN